MSRSSKWAVASVFFAGASICSFGVMVVELAIFRINYGFKQYAEVDFMWMIIALFFASFALLSIMVASHKISKGG